MFPNIPKLLRPYALMIACGFVIPPTAIAVGYLWRLVCEAIGFDHVLAVLLGFIVGMTIFFGTMFAAIDYYFSKDRK